MDNPNKKDNKSRSFQSLGQMTTDIFATFIFQFRMYANDLKLDKETRIDELKDKVNLRLQDAIAAILYKLETLKQLSNLWQWVDNQQRYIIKKRGWLTASSSYLLTRLPSLKIQHTLSAYILAVKWQFIKPAVVITSRFLSSLRKNGVVIKLLEPKDCQYCNKERHFATDFFEKRKKAVREVDTEAKDLKEKQGRGNVREKDVYSESKN